MILAVANTEIGYDRTAMNGTTRRGEFRWGRGWSSEERRIGHHVQEGIELSQRQCIVQSFERPDGRHSSKTLDSYSGRNFYMQPSRDFHRILLIYFHHNRTK